MTALLDTLYESGDVEDDSLTGALRKTHIESCALNHKVALREA
jgi:hypothetical protein